jgi:hypothetical protein
MLRTAFLVYVRVLLCLQGLCLVCLPWLIFPYRGGARLWPLIATAVLVTLLGLAPIATAVRLRRGRPRAAMAAIMIEAAWAVAACAVVLEDLRTSVDAFEYGYGGSGGSETLLWRFLAVAAVLLVTVAGLLLRPVRDYAGLVRR